MALHLAMIVAGIAAMAWGLPACHRLRPPVDAIAALAVPAGLAVALLGALLVAVPGFFKG